MNDVLERLSDEDLDILLSQRLASKCMMTGASIGADGYKQTYNAAGEAAVSVITEYKRRHERPKERERVRGKR